MPITNKSLLSQDTIIKEFSRRLKQSFGDRLKEVILFGSRARGDSEEGSDYDFLIIVDKRTKGIRNIVLDIESDLLHRTNKLLSSLIYSEKEFDIIPNYCIIWDYRGSTSICLLIITKWHEHSWKLY